MTGDGDITHLLTRMRDGQKGASDELYERVYRELRQVAARHMRMERHNHTLQATALVHEVYLRLNKQTVASYENRARFFGAAIGLMREILVDHARRKRARKRGGDVVMVRLDDIQVASTQTAEELLALDDALRRLAEIAPRRAKVVELRYFGEMSTPEIADMLEIDVRTVTRDWNKAEEWLRENLRPSGRAAQAGEQS